ncbi:MAG: formamidopyrimidine-DNA glycosylase [Gemmatimonadota bacterium]|nr:formamidopyrimidine-DNA glycosylase [Gemmatimonadota bacterium]
MPELPEVEAAVRLLRATTEGRTIVRARVMHPSLRARVAPERLRSLAGTRVDRVERRGKHQLLHLADGRTLHAHFRMAGDWLIDRTAAPPPRFARAVVELDDGARIWLVDPRALSTLDVRNAAALLELRLGPEATDPALRPRDLARALSRRRGAIKPALLDQSLIAGIGNIYAAETLWRARLDPRALAASLTQSELARLLAAIRSVMRRALEGAIRFAVYGRERRPCRRCGTPITRIVQAGRSTYFCPSCQARRRAAAPALSRAPRGGRP